jgi:hypothetical protein
MAIRQAAAASGRVAVMEQHGVMFAEQVREDAGGYGSGLRLPACQSSSAPLTTSRRFKSIQPNGSG